MRPPAPPRFRHLLPVSFALHRFVSQPTMMMLRNMSRRPVQAGLTMLGIAFATGIIVVSLFLTDSTEQTMNVTYFLADRQDASIAFVEKRPENVTTQVARLPGVLAAEPFREVPVRIRKENIERRIVISGRLRNADLSRIIDTDLRSVTLPESGLAISSWLARILGVRVGEFVEVDLLEGQRRTVRLPVAALVEEYFGIAGMMDLIALGRLMREAPAVNGVNVSLDGNRLDRFYEAIKGMPTAAGVALRRVSVANYRQTLAITLTTMSGIYTGLAAIIAFGVVYNSARVSLSERGRELASLRVLGFTPRETMRILLLELALIAAIAQPLGWVLGYGLAWLMKMQLSGEVMRAPMIIENRTYVLASAIVFVAALFSALVVARQVSRLDLVAVLKTRE
jgi:putative ABC transport system permease protein